MHPAIRILTLIALASGLPVLPLADLLLLCLVLTGAYTLAAREAVPRLLAGLWRLRWLLCGIALVYWAFTPGEPLSTALPGLSREGAVEGLRRALALIALLVAVYLMLALTPVPQLVAGIRLLATPMRVLGLDPDRLALRMALALDAADEAQAHLAAFGGERTLVSAAADAIEAVERDVPEAAASPALRRLARPRFWEWLLPLAVGALIHWLGR